MAAEFDQDIFETLAKINQLSGDLIVSFLGSLGLDRKKSNELEELKQYTFQNKSYIHIQEKLPSILQAIPKQFSDSDRVIIRRWTERVLQRINLATFFRWLELDNIYNAAKFSFHHISLEERFRGSAVQAAFVDLRTRLLATLVWDEEDQQSEGLKANLDQLMARHLPLEGLVFGLYPEDDQTSMMTRVAARRDMMTNAPDLNVLDALVTTDDLKNTWRKVILTTMPELAKSSMPLDFNPSENDPMLDKDDDSGTNQEATTKEPQDDDGDPMPKSDDPILENDDDSGINQEATTQVDDKDPMTDSNYSTASDGDIDDHREAGDNDSDYQLVSDTDNSDFEINFAEPTNNQHNNENGQPPETTNASDNGRHTSPSEVAAATETGDPLEYQDWPSPTQSSNDIYDDHETESDTRTRRRVASSSESPTTKKRYLRRQWHEQHSGRPTPRIISWDDDSEEENHDDVTARNSTNNDTRPRRRLPAGFEPEASDSQQDENDKYIMVGPRRYRKPRKYRHYVRWTQDEVAALRQGLGECRDRNWGDILRNFKDRFAPGRSSMDLRDKARNEIKRLEALGEELGEFHYAT